jgi:hypothetical protein
MPLAGVINGFFKTLGGFVRDPIRAALVADKGWHVPHNDHAESEVNGKSGCALRFCSPANRTRFFRFHGFLKEL